MIVSEMKRLLQFFWLVVSFFLFFFNLLPSQPRYQILGGHLLNIYWLERTETNKQRRKTSKNRLREKSKAKQNETEKKKKNEKLLRERGGKHKERKNKKNCMKQKERKGNKVRLKEKRKERETGKSDNE